MEFQPTSQYVVVDAKHFFGVYRPILMARLGRREMLRRAWQSGRAWSMKTLKQQEDGEFRRISFIPRRIRFPILSTQNRCTSIGSRQPSPTSMPLANLPFPVLLHTFLNLYVYRGRALSQNSAPLCRCFLRDIISSLLGEAFGNSNEHPAASSPLDLDRTEPVCSVRSGKKFLHRGTHTLEELTYAPTLLPKLSEDRKEPSPGRSRSATDKLERRREGRKVAQPGGRELFGAPLGVAPQLQPLQGMLLRRSPDIYPKELARDMREFFNSLVGRDQPLPRRLGRVARADQGLFFFPWISRISAYACWPTIVPVLSRQRWTV